MLCGQTSGVDDAAQTLDFLFIPVRRSEPRSEKEWSEKMRGRWMRGRRDLLLNDLGVTLFEVVKVVLHHVDFADLLAHYEREDEKEERVSDCQKCRRRWMGGGRGRMRDKKIWLLRRIWKGH